MNHQISINARLNRLAQLLVVLAVLLSFSVEIASTLYDSTRSTIVFEELGTESDSEGQVDFEVDSEVEKTQNRTFALSINRQSAEIDLSTIGNLGLAYIYSPLQQLDAPPPEALLH